jgi:hypothetical protein
MQPAATLKLRLDKRAAAPGVYEVACACGAVLRGPREAHAQTVRCLACQSERFILPRSPLPYVHDGELPAAAGAARRLRWPLFAAAAVVPVAVVGLTVLIYSLVRSPGRDKTPPPPSAEERLAAHREAGRAAFADGSFQRAATELKEALDAADQAPGKIAGAERRELAAQQRQAAILADLLSESLAEIVRNSLGTPEAEWQAVFARRYAGRSVILDETIHRDAAGQYHGDYSVQVTGAECRIDRKALRILKDVDLSVPQRVLLGFRLAGLRRDPQGGWTILPDPDSGVFLTDPRVFKGLSVPADAELHEVLKRQKYWVDQAR